MVQKITKGIKVSVKTAYNGTAYRNHKLYYHFNYFITIENYSEQTVKLTHRFWEIFDSLNHTEIIEGRGVVGQKPILKPSQNYTYKSGCFLQSNRGAMKGFYTMTDLDSSEQFKVIIPAFQLTTLVLLN